MAKPVRRLGNLPSEATSFVGRRRELAEVKKRLSDGRVVSLVGPGGVGKTRLAIRAAIELARSFRDGAWLVALADVQDPGLVANAVMAALDLRDQAASEPAVHLAAYLADKHLLLVLDNCEHLLGAVAQLADEVVKAAPGVSVVATSREPLSITAEHLVPIPPLELPSVNPAEPLASLGQNEAVLLFIDRAAAASGSFGLTESNRASVVNLCRRLDGLPLAIELAAVRTRVLSVDQMVDRLSDRFELLTKGSRAALPRHQTLLTTLDWSHDLLTSDERTLLRRTSVFAGRFTLEDVVAVCAIDAALDLIASLVDKSLVIKEEAYGAACYRLHETMREYARLKVREAGEEEDVERACADYFRSRSQRFGQEVRYHLDEWLEWADLEIDNIRSVLHRCVLQEDVDRGLDLAGSMGWYWITRATTEGVRWLDQLLSYADVDSASHGWAYFMRGFLSVLQADPSTAMPWLARAVAAGRGARDPILLIHSLSMSSVAQRTAGDREAAAQAVAEAESVANVHQEPGSVLSVLQAQAINGFFDGDLPAVRSATSRGIELARKVNDLYALEVMLGELAGTALIPGEVDAARPLYAEGLRTARHIDDRVTQFYYVDALACVVARSGQARLAAQLLGAAAAMQAAAGASVLAFMNPLITQAQESAIAALGESRFDVEFEAGRRMSREAALELALGEPGSRRRAASQDTAGAGLLGRRETDVARLVAEGLSNKQIGARLFISQRTVDAHVRNILNKLGFDSRAQIAAWVSSNQ